MIRLAVVGDSLGLPRFAKGLDKVDLYAEDTYPERLRQHVGKTTGADVMLVNLCRHAQTSLHLLRGLASEVFLARPHAVILELGLADLWPARGRHVPPPFPELAEKDPWVDADAYRHNMDLFLGFCRHSMGRCPPLVLLLNLWTVSPGQFARYPEAAPRIEVYNDILADLAECHGAELFDAMALGRELGPGCLAADGIHWTPAASDVLGRRLGDTLLRRMESLDLPVARDASGEKRAQCGRTP